MGTKNFAILCDGVPIAERMGPKREHLSTMFLYTLQRPYKIPGFELAGLIFFIAQHLELLIILNGFRYSLIRFS